MPTAPPIRAEQPSAAVPVAQYLRMSTEGQQYSMPMQTARIREYADQHGFTVVKTYFDRGKSGLALRNRPALCALLSDVVSGNAPFRAVLVYDVSRWGRFQDTDEAAHYEFVCRTSGIPVHYCAEQFTNNLELTNIILKSLKRTMAAEYSRELSLKVYGALRRAAEAGLRTGSIPGYGFRRMLFSADGGPKQILQDREQKSLRTDRVKLVLGPSEETRVVRWIYRMLTQERLRPRGIIERLNHRGLTFHGRPWSFYAIKQLVTQPKYCGIQVWGRTETKLNTSHKRVPQEQWVTSPIHGAKIVHERVFLRAQRAYFNCTYHKTDEQLLDALRALWRRRGYLSQPMIDASRLTPTVGTYRRRFGRITRALELIGYRQSMARIMKKRRKSAAAHDELRRQLIRRLELLFPRLVVRGHYKGFVRCPEAGFDVFVSICRRAVRVHPAWIVSPRHSRRKTITLLCLLNRSNTRIKHLYVVPWLPAKRSFSLGISWEALPEHKKLSSLRYFYNAVVETHKRLPTTFHETNVLIGVHQMATHLGLSEQVVRRLIRQGLPVTRQDSARCARAVPYQLDQWIREHGTAWQPARNRHGRFLPSQRS